MAICLLGIGHSASVIASGCGQYALKQFKHNARNSFMTEVDILRMLPAYHKNKVEVIEVRDNVMEIVMRLYDCDLLFFLQSHYPQGMPIDLARNFYTQLINALDFLHSNCVYHRDVKLENLLLNGTENIVISDFGLSIVSHTDISPLHINGTEMYMPPEMWEYIFSKHSVNRFYRREYTLSKADLFSSAICLYNLLANELAFLKAHTSDPSYRYFKEDPKQWWGNNKHDFDDSLKSFLNSALLHNSGERLSIEEIRLHDWFVGRIDDTNFT